MTSDRQIATKIRIKKAIVKAIDDNPGIGKQELFRMLYPQMSDTLFRRYWNELERDGHISHVACFVRKPYSGEDDEK